MTERNCGVCFSSICTKIGKRGFPGGPVVKTLCFYSGGGLGSIPGGGAKSLHAQQRSNKQINKYLKLKIKVVGIIPEKISMAPVQE